VFGSVFGSGHQIRVQPEMRDRGHGFFDTVCSVMSLVLLMLTSCRSCHFTAEMPVTITFIDKESSGQLQKERREKREGAVRRAQKHWDASLRFSKSAGHTQHGTAINTVELLLD